MLLVSYCLLDIIPLAEIERTAYIGIKSSKSYSEQNKTQKQYKGNSKYYYM